MRLLLTYENRVPNDQADAEQFVNTAAALANVGHEVELVVPHMPGALPVEPAEILAYFQVDAPIRIRSIPTGHRLRWLQHVRHVQAVSSDPSTRGYDLVYTRNLGMLTACLARGHHAAYEHFRPWGDQFPPMQPWLRRVLRHPRCVAAYFHSDFARRTYLRLGVPEEKLGVLHNGYEPKRVEPRLTKAEAREALELPKDADLVVYTGRMNHKKGLDVVLAMAERLRDRRDLRFVLVGSTGEGAVEEAAARLPNVIVRPWQSFDRVVRYLYAADVLLVPPSLDPLLHHGNTVLPIKLFSYLAVHRAIFGGRTPDSVELLHHGDNAWLTDPVHASDADRPAADLVALLDDDPLRAKLADGAARTAAGLTWVSRGRRLGEALEAALSRDTQPDAPDPWAVRPWLRETGHWLRRGLTEGRLVGVSGKDRGRHLNGSRAIATSARPAGRARASQRSGG